MWRIICVVYFYCEYGGGYWFWCWILCSWFYIGWMVREFWVFWVICSFFRRSVFWRINYRNGGSKCIFGGCWECVIDFSWGCVDEGWNSWEGGYGFVIEICRG